MPQRSQIYETIRPGICTFGQKNVMLKKLLVSVSIAVVVFACAKVAVTGRSQLNLVPNSEIIPMSDKEYKDVIAKGPLSTNKEQTEMIKRVGLKIEKAVESYMAQKNLSSELEGFHWEFNLIDDPKTVNAWCMPGGKVAFYTGIMPICENETGIAVVMGHEVAHAIANHGRERMSEQLVAQYGLSTLGALMGQNPSAGQDLLMQAVGAGTNLGMLKFSRSQESEADHIGLIFMTIAGYDPNQAPIFWERMTKLSGGQEPPEFLSTHPSHSTRVADLKGWIPEAMGYKKN
jgi:predicted Zn-dependent protease